MNRDSGRSSGDRRCAGPEVSSSENDVVLAARGGRGLVKGYGRPDETMQRACPPWRIRACPREGRRNGLGGSGCRATALGRYEGVAPTAFGGLAVEQGEFTGSSTGTGIVGAVLETVARGVWAMLDGREDG